jgi:hypothetical protein
VKRYRFHREALDEYMAARGWYAERSELARAFVASVERAIRKIRRMLGQQKASGNKDT